MTTEYEISEKVNGEWKPLVQCGSWYSDRHYTNGLTGRGAAEAALKRVKDAVPGEYRVQPVRTFTR